MMDTMKDLGIQEISDSILEYNQIQKRIRGLDSLKPLISLSFQKYELETLEKTRREIVEDIVRSKRSEFVVWSHDQSILPKIIDFIEKHRIFLREEIKKAVDSGVPNFDRIQSLTDELKVTFC